MLHFEQWMYVTPVPILGIILFGSMVLAGFVGNYLRKRKIARDGEETDQGNTQEGYVVSAVLGLLALLLGFTFSLAVDRFDSRRILVLEESNAIGTAYLRSQLLDEPHRTRMSTILHDYTENRVKLGQATVGEGQRQLLAINDKLLNDLWSATAASFDSVRHLDFSTPLIESVNAVIDDDSARKAARFARVPVGVFLVLFIYVLTSAALLGYVLGSGRKRIGTTVFLALLATSMLLIIDIDGPSTGLIRESQLPMVLLRDNLRSMPPGSYDKWRMGVAQSQKLESRALPASVPSPSP